MVKCKVTGSDKHTRNTEKEGEGDITAIIMTVVAIIFNDEYNVKI